MPGFTPFTSNFEDLSNSQGYQFEFKCDICGSGYRSQFIRSATGTGATLLEGASNLFGGIFGDASNAAETAQEMVSGEAHDKALEKACNEILAAEMEAERSQAELAQMREAMQGQKVFSGDTSARQTECPNCGKPVGSEKFCSNCGTALGTAKCPKCGNELASGAKFCGNCGGKVG
jgi:hypothetical protein